MKTKLKLPGSFYNRITYLGTGLAVISFLVFVIFALLGKLLGFDATYAGIITYIIIPVFLIIGLVLIPVGMIRKYRKDNKKEAKDIVKEKFPVLDFNDPKTFNALLIFFPVTIILVILTAVGTYKAYHYTESVEFCGKVCHRVMEPEYVTYQHSPHQRVACVECHIGSGADWYVKSKLSGLYQVYSVIFNKYSRPIETPISNLRPARETCEECHWPEKYYPYTLRIEHHYLPDEASSPWNINIIMKTSASVSALGLSEGIHWHINPNVEVQYKSFNKREFIPWVKYINHQTGEEFIYTLKDTVIDEKAYDSAEHRLMDCLDCHNRPSHNYKSPMTFVNEALTSGKISRELPDVKYVAMDVLNHVESSILDSILLEIKNDVYEYYSFMYEDLFQEQRDKIDNFITILQEEYRNNFFPEMNASWKSYPNHIGHLEVLGCFRCHDDRHVSNNGKVISRDCNLCHVIVSQSGPDTTMVGSVNQPLEFYHMDDDVQAWKTKLCVECHKDLYME